jgi:ribosomal protein S18 acetylase RimI-like enzyme
MKYPAELHEVRRADLSRACDVLTQAFAQDPFYSYMTGGHPHDAGIAAFFHLFTLNYGLRYGIVHAPSPGIEGVAIWLPPGRTEMTGWRSLIAGVSTVSAAGIPKTAGRSGLMPRLAGYGSFAAKIHERHARFPHWYLMVLGVADAYRGMGFAGRLLRPVLERLDSLGLPCYLETHNPANPPIYEHFGFRIAETARLPGSENSHWAMLRLPAPDGGCGS